MAWLWDMRKACSIIQSITPLVLLIPFLMVTVGQVISAGLDKKILFWDMRMAKAIEYLRNLGAEVDSMSLFGSNFLVAIGSSIHEYDLRKLDKLVQSKESHLNIRIRCVSSIPYSKGIITVISFFFCCKPCSYCGWRQLQWKAMSLSKVPNTGIFISANWIFEYTSYPSFKKNNSIQGLQCLRLPSFLDSLLDPLYNHTNMIPFRRL